MEEPIKLNAGQALVKLRWDKATTEQKKKQSDLMVKARLLKLKNKNNGKKDN